MARIALKKGAGPAPWHIMLAGFDTHPAGAHGIRTLDFTLVNGKRIHMALRSIDWGEYPNTDSWTLVGYQTTLPHGYTRPDYPEDTTIVVEYDPFGKSGEVELKLVSPCHLATLEEVVAQGDNMWEWQCATCHQAVMRIDPFTGDEQWLDADGKGGDEVGVVHCQGVWISYRRLDAGEDELTICTSGSQGDVVFLEAPDMLDIVPGVLTGIRPCGSPRKECGLYYKLRGNVFGMTPDTQAVLGRTLGPELMHRLRQIQTAGKAVDALPLALCEPLPPFSAVAPVNARIKPVMDATSGDAPN